MANEKIWAFLAHLGYNMWADPLEKDGIHSIHTRGPHGNARSFLRFDRDLWNEVTDRLAAAGANMIVLDIGEGIRYDSHPELAAEGAWSKDEVRRELDRLNGMGLEVIPKLNFSACHDEWMGVYARCLSTPMYYQFVEEIVAETAELFGNPRFFHVGMDEEDFGNQRYYNYVVIRQGELWWHDFNRLIACVEKTGARPWMWADYVWGHSEEFLAKMSRDVVMSNWYYGNFENLPEDSTSGARAYDLLDKNGFDQIPGGSNWSCDENFVRTVQYGRERLSDERTLGYLQTVWHPMLRSEEERQYHGIEQIALARQGVIL